MNFFEFFFSGPNWGWRLFGLIWLISLVGEIIVKLVKVVLNYKVDKFKTQIAEAMNNLQCPTNKDTKKDNDNADTPATIDDFRQ
jgi:hypothetical protein